MSLVMFFHGLDVSHAFRSHEGLPVMQWSVCHVQRTACDVGRSVCHVPQLQS